MNRREFDSHLLVDSGNQDFDEDINTLLTVFDAIARKWSVKECEAIFLKLHNWSQTEIADHLQINQSAVHKRLKSADYYTVETVLKRWTELVDDTFSATRKDSQ